MRNLVTLSDSIGGNLTGAGFALETIANLLGADGSEHFLNKDHINGLVHAVLTISVYVKDAGYSLCEAAEIAQEGGALMTSWPWLPRKPSSRSAIAGSRPAGWMRWSSRFTTCWRVAGLMWE